MSYVAGEFYSAAPTELAKLPAVRQPPPDLGQLLSQIPMAYYLLTALAQWSAAP